MNLTGACGKCNRAKGTRRLLEFLAGLQPGMDPQDIPLARFGKLTVAAANLDEARRNGQADRCGTTTVLSALLRARPDAEGALAYRHRHKRRGRRAAWIHALMTREGEADAGAACRRLGGGGNRTRGGVESNEPLFVASTKPGRKAAS